MEAPAGGRRRGTAAASPPGPVADLLQQLRALGMGQGKTYAGMAAASRSSGAGYAASGGRDGRSAFFRHADAKVKHWLSPPSTCLSHSSTSNLPSDNAAFPRLQARPRGTPAAGSATPPTAARPAPRVPTPGSAASPFPDDDILFQMSGLKPLRTASRTERERRGQQPGERGMHRTQSAPTADEAVVAAAAGRSPPLSRAFSFAGEPSPRTQAVPLPTVPRGAAGAPAAAAAAAASDARQHASLAGGVADAVELELGPEPLSAPPASGRGPAGPAEPGAAAAQAEPEEAAAAAAASPPPAGGAAAADEDAAPAWSEELLNWMLGEKTGLLVEAQRAQRRQRELGAEVERLRAWGAGAEREVQRLTVRKGQERVRVVLGSEH